MFKGALQEMMNAEFDSSMGYSKYDKTKEKTNYRNSLFGKSIVFLCFLWFNIIKVGVINEKNFCCR